MNSHSHWLQYLHWKLVYGVRSSVAAVADLIAVARRRSFGKPGRGVGFLGDGIPAAHPVASFAGFRKVVPVGPVLDILLGVEIVAGHGLADYVPAADVEAPVSAGIEFQGGWNHIVIIIAWVIREVRGLFYENLMGISGDEFSL